MALPLLIPWNVVGTIWQIFGRGRHRPARRAVNSLGIDYNYTADPLDAWLTIVVMDVWHWTPLVALLCYAGLRAIPDAYYQAAASTAPRRWAVFRYIQLPKMRGVLTDRRAAALHGQLHDLHRAVRASPAAAPATPRPSCRSTWRRSRVGQFDLGPAAAISIVYFLIILLLCWVFYTVMTQVGPRGGAEP